MWHSEFKLCLYPDNSQYKIDEKKLKNALQNLKFIGDALSSKRYAIGNDFLLLLTFMGCSPNIELEPQNDKPYCYIEIETYEQPQFISGKNTKYPPCPQCKENLNAQVCSYCNATLDVTKPNWRKSAFIASSWISIGNIYELEAIPNDQLLSVLENETGVRWKPAYIRQEIK
ncbi:MAG: hypothetical protein L3J51_11945 [Cocleimonas sp.]|nr:hypothetical protein [Cocleimonas sp.]